MEKVAVVEAAAAFAKVTVPGPLTFVHPIVTPVPGRPSSVTEPASVATVVGNVIATSGPALTTGAWLPTPAAVIETSSLPESRPSLAVNVST